MAKVIYGAAEYQIADEDVLAFKQACSNAAVTGAEWLVVGTATGTASLFVTCGVNISIEVDSPGA